MKLVLAILLSILISSLMLEMAYAADYYFDNTLGSDAADCSEATPCQTNDKYDTLVAAASCGDSFFFKKGEVWTANDSTDRLRITDKSCTETTPIILTTYGSGAMPIMDGGTQSSSFDGFTITSSSFIVIDGIHFRDWVTGGSVLGSSDITLKNNKLENAWKECARTRRFSLTGGSGTNSTRVRWEKNAVLTCGLNGSNGEGFYTGVDGSQNGGNPDTSSFITYIWNDITGNTHESIELKPGITDTLIQDNYFHDVTLGTGGPGAVAVSGSANNSTIVNNYFKDIAGAGGHCIFLKGSGTATGNVCDNPGAAGINYQNTGNNPVRVIANNVIYSSAAAAVSGSGSNTTIVNNLARDNLSGNTSYDPLFVDDVGGNFSLQAGSQAINNCVPVAGVGANAPANDCGAYEPPVLLTSAIGSVAADKIVLVFETNRHPGLAGCSTTGWSSKLNGAANAVTAIGCVGSTVTLTVTNPVTLDTDDVLVSYTSATGTLTDVKPISFPFAQKVHSFTDVVVTNELTGGGPTTITFVAAGAAAGSITNTSPAVGLPAGIAVGDLHVCAIAGRDASFTATLPAGWNPIASTAGLLAWYKLHESGETAPVFTLTGNTDDVIAQCAAWRGVHPTNIVSAVGTVYTAGGGADIGPIPGVTVPGAGLVIVFGSKNVEGQTVETLTDAGITLVEISESISDAGGDNARGTMLVWDYGIEGTLSPVAVTDKTFDTVGAATDGRRGFMVSFNPDQANPPAEITFANLGTSANPDINSSTDATSYANSSWTPPTTGLILLFVSSANAAGAGVVPTVSGNSITWVEIETVAFSTSRRLTLFAAVATGSTTGATTISFSETQSHVVGLFSHAEGVDTSSGALAAFVQADNATGASGTTATVVLAAGSNAANRAIAGTHNGANATITPRANWTELDDLAGASTGRTAETQYRGDAFETTATSTWGTSTVWAIIAGELKAAEGGEPPPSGPPVGASMLTLGCCK